MEVTSIEVLLERRTGSAFILYRWNKLQLRSRTGVNSIGQTEPYLSGHNDHGTTSLCKIHLYFLQSIVTLRQLQRNSYGFVQWQPAVATIWKWKLRLKAQQNAEAGTSNQCHEDETEIPQTFSAPAHETWTVTETFFLRSLGTFGLVSDNMEPEEKKSSVKKRDRMIQLHLFREAGSGTVRCMHLYGMTSKMSSLYVMSSYPCKKLT